jgi:putative colanic acid biosynthesis acetyltransferase WcaF
MMQYTKYKIDLSKYQNTLGRKHQITRFFWTIIWTIFARPLPCSIGKRWKIFLLRLFGANIHPTVVIYSSCKVYYPANLTMEEYSCLGSDVNCYNVDKIIIGAHSTISQGAYLCTASHDISKSHNPLITAPIVIADQVWVASDAFIGMGVTLGQGAVVGARAAVFKNVEPWTVVGGNPARLIKKRETKD